jgi:hypothetical protein
VTGALERPSQGAPENRKAAEDRRPGLDLVRGTRRALTSLAAADMQVLVAAQRDARNRALSALTAALGAAHGSQRASVVALYAARRAAAASISDPVARKAAILSLVQEEAAELARLAVAHAQERRRLTQETLAALGLAHRAARLSHRRASRRTKIVMVIRMTSKVRAELPPSARLRHKRHRVATKWVAFSRKP